MRRSFAPLACMFATLTVSAQTSQPIPTPVRRGGPIGRPQQGVRPTAGNSFTRDMSGIARDLKLSADQQVARRTCNQDLTASRHQRLASAVRLLGTLLSQFGCFLLHQLEDATERDLLVRAQLQISGNAR